MTRAALMLLALCVVAAAVSGCRGAEGDRSGVIVSPDMAMSVPYDPYDPNPATPTGMTLLVPPEGSVPVGASRFSYAAGPEQAVLAGQEVSNPYPSNRENLARGKRVYEIFCAVCHGAEGKGDGPVAGRAGFPKPPDLLSNAPKRAPSLPDGTLFHIITRGQGAMAAYAGQVTAEDRWLVIHYIRSLKGGTP